MSFNVSQQLQSRSTVSLLLSVLFALIAAPLGTNPLLGSPHEPRTSSANPDTIAELIDQLGASRFSDRERASHALLGMGLDVYEALLQIQDHPDRETRLRVRQLLAELVDIDRRNKLAQFVAERSHAETALPGWRQFCQIAGDTPASRELMAEMLDENWELLARADVDGSAAGALLIQRCEELQYSLSLRRRHISRSDVATLLLIAVNPDVGVYKNTQQQIYNFCYRIRVAPQSSKQTGQDDPLRKLLGAWVARPGDVANTAFYSLNIALRYSLPEGLIPAEQILAENTAAPYIRQYAILTVGRFKDHGSRERLELLLSDESICYTQTDPKTKKVAFQSQIRDVALATLLHLYGRNPADFGFERVRRSANMVFQPNTLGFVSEAKRTKAFEAFHELRDVAGF